MNNLVKTVAIWLVIAIVLMTVFNQVGGQKSAQKPLDYSVFLEEVRQGRVAKATFLEGGRVIKGVKVNGEKFETYAVPDRDLVNDLVRYGVAIEAKPDEGPSVLMNIFVSWFPMLL